jgi:hypothetical protein
MKKDVPLAVLKAIEPFIEKMDFKEIKVETDNNLVLRIVDAEEGSGLFFEIVSQAPNGANSIVLEIRHKPASPTNIGVFAGRIAIGSFANVFAAWYSMIEEYRKTKTLFDDPILKKYAEDFYTEFESADEDANTLSFNLKQQLLLDNALTQVIQVLDEQTTEANKEVIAEIIEEVVEVQSTVTENTKQETFTKMSRIFAKIQKAGIKVIKHVAPIIEKEIIGAIIKSGVTAAGVGIASAAATHLLN